MAILLTLVLVLVLFAILEAANEKEKDKERVVQRKIFFDTFGVEVPSSGPTTKWTSMYQKVVDGKIDHLRTMVQLSKEASEKASTAYADAREAGNVNQLEELNMKVNSAALQFATDTKRFHDACAIAKYESFSINENL